MNTDQTNASSPPYLAYYGMTREPFAAKIESDLFYPEPTRKQRLEILLHLTQYGEELMLVTGPEGSGKTTLLQQFQQQALEGWSIARIEAGGGMDDQQLLQQLFAQLALELENASNEDLLKKITHHYDALQRSARLGVIVVDDAEQLHSATLKNILGLAALKTTDNRPLVRVILFAREELADMLREPQLEQHAQVPQRAVELQALDLDQTTHYILHRLSAAGFSDSKPFTDSAISKIYKQSGGWPGRINQLSNQLLIDSLPAISADELPVSGTTFTPMRTILLALLAAVIIGLLVFQDDINRLMQAQENETTQISIPLPEPVTESVQKAQPQETVPGSEAMATDAMATPDMAATDGATADTPARDDEASLSQAMMEISSMQADSPPMTETGTADSAAMPAEQGATGSPMQSAMEETSEAPLAAPAPAPANAPAEAGDEESVATEKAPSTESMPAATGPAPVVSKPPASKPAPAKKTTSTKTPRPAAPELAQLPAHGNDWLLQQKASNYTLQLVAGNDAETIRRFISEHKLQEQLALYQTTRNGKPWYVLLYGLYPDKPTAVGVRDRLPTALRSAKPWVRELGGIQSTLQ